MLETFFKDVFHICKFLQINENFRRVFPVIFSKKCILAVDFYFFVEVLVGVCFFIFLYLNSFLPL